MKPKTVRIFFATIFLSALLAMIWPIYPLFNHIRPLILGMPLSLFFLIAVLAYCFVSLVLLYFWEKRRGELD